MTETIICAVITGGLTLLGVIIANSKTQAVTEARLDELTREVREHKYWVYKHTFPNGKVYIGITSQYPCARWKNGNGYGYNKIFTRALRKYGWDNVKHEIMACGLSKEDACSMETDLIKKHRSNVSQYGYNQSSGGEHGGTGVQISTETRNKKSASMKGKNRGINLGGNSVRAKAVRQYEKNGAFISEYRATTEAQRATGVSHTGIIKSCTFHQLTAGGYIWLYAWDSDRLPEKVNACNTQKAQSKESNEKRSQSLRKYWSQREG